MLDYLVDANRLTERERDDVNFCIAYAQKYNHGADGHTRMILVYKLATLIVELSSEIRSMKREINFAREKCLTSDS